MGMEADATVGVGKHIDYRRSGTRVSVELIGRRKVDPERRLQC
jgi:hypothetical protein